MSEAHAASAVPGPSSEAERPSSPGYTYSFPSSRRDTESSTGSEVHSFYRMPYHGNCGACKHRYNGEDIKLPRDKNSFRGVRCEKCHSNMMGFGGNSTHLSLISIESIDPTHVQDERTYRANIGSTVLRSASLPLGNLPESRAVSRGPSIHDAAPSADAVHPQIAPVASSEGPVASQTVTHPPVIGNSPVRENHLSELDQIPTNRRAPSAHNRRSLVRWAKAMLEHSVGIKKLSSERKRLHSAIKKKFKKESKPRAATEEMSANPSYYTKEPHTHNTVTEPQQPEGPLSSTVGHQRTDVEDNAGGVPKDGNDIVSRLRRKYTELRHTRYHHGCNCPSHPRHFEVNRATVPHPNGSDDQAGGPMSSFLHGRDSPVNHRMVGHPSHDSDLMHTGEHFEDVSSDRRGSLSISTTFSHARTAVGTESVPALSSYLPHLLPSMRSQSPRLLPPTSNPRDPYPYASRNGRGTPDTTMTGDVPDLASRRVSALDGVNGRLTPESHRNSIPIQDDEGSALQRPSRASTPHVNGYRISDERNYDVTTHGHYSG